MKGCTVSDSMKKLFPARSCLVLIPMGLLAGCTGLSPKSDWGQHATLRPGWSRIGSAAWSAASSPATWAPAGTALLLQIDHADERISDWAIENRPLFGSSGSAETASDVLLASSIILYGATLLAIPPAGGESQFPFEGAGIQSSALLFTLGTTELLKAATSRTRPNAEDQKSFPSGHTALSATSGMLAYRNAGFLEIPRWGKNTLGAGALALPYATGWARIEAGKHYPSDILAGAALGSFLATFVNDAFMGADSADDLRISIRYLPHETFMVGFSRCF